MFQAYNIMIGYMYILQNDPHNKSSYSSPHVVTKKFLLWWEMLRSTLLAISNIQYSIVNYSHHAVHYIPRTYL